MSRLLPLFLLTACGNPCTGSDGSTLCTGTLEVDLSGEVPTFDIVGLGAVTPDQIQVAPSDLCEGGAMPVWEVWGLQPDSLPLTYANVPSGSREVVAAESPILGTTYLVFLGRHDGLIPGQSASGASEWVGLYTWGDPDSFVIAADCEI